MYVCVCMLIREKALSNSFHPQLEIIEILIEAQAQWHRPPVFYVEWEEEVISIAVSINRNDTHIIIAGSIHCLRAFRCSVCHIQKAVWSLSYDYSIFFTYIQCTRVLWPTPQRPQGSLSISMFCSSTRPDSLTQHEETSRSEAKEESCYSY